MTLLDFAVEPTHMPYENEDRIVLEARSVASMEVIFRPSTPCTFVARIDALASDLRRMEKELAALPASSSPHDPQKAANRIALADLRANYRQLRSALFAMSDARSRITQLPRAASASGTGTPRVFVVADRYFRAVDYTFSAETFRAFLRTMQAQEPLTLKELWTISLFLRFVLLEAVIKKARTLLHVHGVSVASALLVPLKSLRDITNADWEFLIEPLIEFDAVLRQDPAAAYASMDFRSREHYRQRIAFIARHSDCPESQVAKEALLLARQGSRENSPDSRIRLRRMHVGYYILDRGFPELAQRVGFHPPVSWRMRNFVRTNGEDFYIEGILLFTLFLIAAPLFPVLPHFSSVTSAFIAVFFLFLPAMQGAVDLVNNAITALFEPDPLPKLNFSEGIPTECTTLVAVPSLLLSEKQIRKLVNDLEVRYLANRNRNLHFVLLTDLQDSLSKPNENDSHPLVDLAVRLVNDLNAKYAASDQGSFLLLHRHRRYNVRQEVWMGWERKRGKLLDLNKLLAGEYDAFPIKTGHLEVLRQVRYILTLDADTQLPRGVAAELVGAIAHPLNQAVVDPTHRIVTSGYGILQPRIGITVQSTARSRLGAIYSGQNGFDIYTRATSDAYQDLFSEGIFTGKGIYEVATLHAVLNHRFPRNSLLSHDLIEGAYARAGLATDIELVEDYPSHYSAYSRRQHRWVRGDWQIAQWMFSRVPDESGRRVSNPISSVNRWKIFDNLRRSLVSPFFFMLFIAGWMGLPGGPVYWTIIPILLLIFPTIVQLGFGIGRALSVEHKGEMPQVISGFGHALLVALLELVLLPHKAVLAIDAVVRSLIRRLITGKRLLEWETAAQAESLNGSRAPADRYLALVPLITIGVAILIWLTAPRHSTLLVAAPVLILWLLGVQVTAWLNRPPHQEQPLSRSDEDFLTGHALRIWHYFYQFGSEAHNYLIPDNVTEDGGVEAARVSPTNIGLLLNARQAAQELGFLTLPEFADLTTRSLFTIKRLEKFRGHLFNWYGTKTLQPLNASPFISTVDSGNFVASLYTLHSGARKMAEQPLIEPRLFAGLRTYWRMARDHRALPSSLATLGLPHPEATQTEWATWLHSANATVHTGPVPHSMSSDSIWWMEQTRSRILKLYALFHDFMPWMLPEYKSLRALPGLGINGKGNKLSLEETLLFAESFGTRLASTCSQIASDNVLSQLCRLLQTALPAAVANLRALSASMQAIVRDSEQMAQETEFAFLVNPDRKILSIGYDMGAQHLHEACYDMIASEARIATFLAVARGDLPHQSWFKLSRDHVRAFDRFLLLSWSGTMFEYMMPALWMRSFQGTLLSNTQSAVVHVQREFAEKLHLPWGISESGGATKNDKGDYHYQAYGIPQISLWGEANAGPVISPYSTFLALGVDAPAAIHNLRQMESSKWVGACGFYEAADYISSRRTPAQVREWMAHHQGMSLLAVTNLLHGNVVQKWFHANPLVQATELLLHELPVNKATLKARMRETTPLGT
jgi:cyclic beta-1,2-glucan synthetase